MHIHVRFFATLKDRAGVAQTNLDLPALATVATLINYLSDQYPNLTPALPSALVAVNQEYAFPTTELNEGDEVALFPPVSGGSGDSEWPEYFAVTEDILDLDAILALITRPETGAAAIFSGAVRGATIKPGMPEVTNYLHYEAYVPMAEKTLHQIATEIRERWPKVQGIAIVQRIGRLEVGETTILVACSSAHRNDGIFEAAHYGINRVKEIVPIWKKEVGPDGSLWIEGEYRPNPTDVRSTNDSSSFIIGCPTCEGQFALTDQRYICDCGEPLQIISSPAFNPALIDSSTNSMWRYKAFLTPSNIEPITLGEGWTPLISLPYEQGNLFAKLEGTNPTGSFKDRGASTLVSLLHAHQITTIHDDSSGNAGAALAAYAARAGVQARLFVPSATSPVKLAQIELYGAQLAKIDGPRTLSAEAAQIAAKSGGSYYASHIYHPMAIMGYKSIAYEIWEQLGQRAPDVIIVPLGHGSQVLGLAWGFNDLLNAGLISHLPRLIGVQTKSCAPIWQEFHNQPLTANDAFTLAEGIRITQPIRHAEIINAIQTSGGDILTVSETEILDGFIALARFGIAVEPTSAVVWSALKKISANLPKAVTIVLSISGSGLKTPQLDTLVNQIKQDAL